MVGRRSLARGCWGLAIVCVASLGSPAAAQFVPIQAISPAPNAHTVDADANVLVTYYNNVSPSTVHTAALPIYSRFRGKMSGDYGSTGPTAWFNFDVPVLLDGEQIWVTATSDILDIASSPMRSWSWAFVADVRGGNAFFDSGMALGNWLSYDVALGDLDADGDLDAFVATSGAAHQLWINDGTGAFTSTSLANTSEATGVALGDLNGDGLIDAVVSIKNGLNQIWTNTGFSFVPSTFGNPLLSTDVAIADFNNDGMLDAYLVHDNARDEVWFNDGTGGLTTFASPTSTHRGDSVALGDIDNDGWIDAVVADIVVGAQVVRNTGAGWSATIIGAGQGQGVALGDIDDDGDLDLYLARGGLTLRADRVFFNNSGIFTDSGQSLGNRDSYDVRLIDIDADGDLDAVVANSDYAIDSSSNEVWLNAGNGDFGMQPAQLIISAGKNYEQTYGLDLGDLDGDGDLDLFVANVGVQFNTDAVWFNNTSPTITANAGLTVAEGGSSIIGQARLSSTDVDDVVTTLIYTVTQTPTNGELQVDGVPLGSGAQFVQADIDGGLLAYRHNGNETTSDSFHFRVSDVHGAQTADNTFAIVVNATNDAPAVSVNQGATVAEAGSVVITGSQLRAIDADDLNPVVLLFTVTIPPARGQVLRQGTPATTFTQDDINNGRVSYQHNGAEQSTDTFTFTVQDDGTPPAVTAPQVFNLTVTPVNDAPTVATNTGATVAEGQTVVVTSSMLQAADVDNSAGQLTFVVQQIPVNGSLLIGAAPIVLNGTFTQADVDSGSLGYRHNGSETTSDSFRFVVRDPGNALSPVTTFTIGVTAVNDTPVITTNTGVTVAEAGNVTIDRGRLETTDVDNTPGQLTYTLTQVPINGALRIGVTTIPLNGTFTQVDVNGNSLNYQQNGSQTTSDSFRFIVRDSGTPTGETAETVFAITVSAVNNSPTITLNTGATVAEAGTVFINNSSLAATDPDDPIPSLVYTVLAIPVNGTLRNGVTAIIVGGTFTQGDLNAGNVISYVHNGSETTSDSFRFNVRDAGNGTSPAATFILTITPVNDPPQIVANLGLTLAEGATATVTSAALQATDAETAAGALVYTLTQAVSYGALRRDGTPLAVNATFTQDDINTGKISYAHDGTENFADSFRYTVRDGGTPLGVTVEQTFAIVITTVNDAPVVLTNLGLVLDEGTQATISDADLAATDVDNLPASLTYVVLQVTSVGTLRAGTTALVANSTFTQGDINAGVINYLHNGSETVSDSFQFLVRDAGGASTAAATFSIVIVPGNDPPLVVRNSGLTVSEGGSGLVLNTALQVTDADDPASALIYRLTGVPANGVLLRGTTALAVNGTFSQSDIDDSAMSYQHNGGETTVDSFRFTVTDGTATLGERVFALTITPVNDTPEIIVNSGVSLLEGGSAIISSMLLAATDPDNAPAQLRFRVLQVPAHGSLLVGSTPVTANGTFLQTDIDTNNVRYTHDGTNTTSDTFRFEVTDGSATSAAATFNIAITAVNTSPFQVKNEGAAVDEGGAVTLTLALLSFDDLDNVSGTLVYRLTAAPIRGTLYNNIAPLANGSIFMQDNIARGRISYLHDGSETTGDQFSFTVEDNFGAQVGPFDFVITVRPVNDLPVLVNNQVLGLNEGDITVTISSALLSYSDAEQTAANLTYRLVLAPVNGTLLRGAAPLAVNGTFTQADINGGLLRYTHGGSETVDDSFTFEVSDGVGTASPQVFLILVTPVNDAPTIARNVTLYVVEGASAVIDNSALRGNDVDDDSSQLLFTVGQVPVNGQLLLNSVPLAASSTFTQSDVNSLALSYTHNGGESTADSFTFNVRDPHNAPAPASGFVAFQIVVRSYNDGPVVTVNTGASVAETGTVVISNSMLRASDPDDSAANLTYTVTRLPGHGRLRNGVTTLLINGRVLQSDIDAGRLAYINAGDEADTDSFAFRVRDAAGLETAEQTFAITIGAANDSPVVAQNSGATVAEAGSFVFSAALLRAEDPDHAVDTLVFSLRSVPTAGSLLLNSQALAVGGTFAQSDIDGGLLVYQNNGAELSHDSLSFVVTDPLNATSVVTTFSITVTAVNDPPTLVNNGIILDEGATSTVTTAQLSATDPDGTAATLVFTLLQAPVHGVLALGAAPLAAGGTFTQSALASGALNYTHDGGETSADSFGFRVRDDLNAQTADSTFMITITPINDAPVVTAIGNQTIVTGATFTPIPLADHVTDVDNVAGQLTWTATGAVNLLVIVDSGSVAHVSERSAGWIGSEVLTFVVSDGVATASTGATFTVSTTANVAPAFVDPTPTGTVAATANRELTFTLVAEDPEGADVTYGATGLPLGAAVEASTGNFHWTPSAFDVGQHPVTLTASDGELAATRDIIIAVAPPAMPDGGGLDAATAGDAGPLTDGGGCDCRAQSAVGREWLALLAVVGALLRRRRK